MITKDSTRVYGSTRSSPDVGTSLIIAHRQPAARPFPGIARHDLEKRTCTFASLTLRRLHTA